MITNKKKKQNKKTKKQQQKTKTKKNRKKSWKKENLAYYWLCIAGRPLRVNQRKWKDKQILRPCQRTKKLWNIKMTVILLVIGALGRIPKSLVSWLKVGNGRTSREHSNSSIVEVGQNTEKSPWDVRRLVVTRTPVKDHHLTFVWKTC